MTIAAFGPTVRVGIDEASRTASSEATQPAVQNRPPTPPDNPPSKTGLENQEDDAGNGPEVPPAGSPASRAGYSARRERDSLVPTPAPRPQLVASQDGEGQAILTGWGEAGHGVGTASANGTDEIDYQAIVEAAPFLVHERRVAASIKGLSKAHHLVPKPRGSIKRQRSIGTAVNRLAPTTGLPAPIRREKA